MDSSATSLGIQRRLQQCMSDTGMFCILAIDHRGPLRQSLGADLQKNKADERLRQFKTDTVHELANVSTAVLLDPETGVGPCVSERALPGGVGLIVAADTGSTGEVGVYHTTLIEEWTIDDSLRVGAAGVKLLLYYHPDLADAPARQQIVRDVAEECHQRQLPLFLEPMSLSIDGSTSPVSGAERKRVVIESARQLIPLGVDVLKAEFPIDVQSNPDTDCWHSACQELTAACSVPWVLLSAGVSFETFALQTQIACSAGARGVMVGRAVWKEAVTSDRASRLEFLRTTGVARMKELRELTDQWGG